MEKQKWANILTWLGLILQLITESASKLEMAHSTFKHKFHLLVLSAVIGISLLFSLWISLLALSFVFFIHLDFSYLHAALITSGINILLLAIAFIWFLHIHRQVKSSKLYTGSLILHQLLKSLKLFSGKK